MGSWPEANEVQKTIFPELALLCNCAGGFAKKLSFQFDNLCRLETGFVDISKDCCRQK